jgi:hypothetical protein
MSEENSVEVNASSAVNEPVVVEQADLGQEPIVESAENSNVDNNGQSNNTNEDAIRENDQSHEDERWIGKRLERAKAKEREQAQAEINYWKQEAQKAYQSNNQSQTQVQPIVNQQPANQSRPQLVQYSTIEEYTEAVTDWKLNQRFNQQSQQAQQAQVINTYTERAKAFADKTPDFKESVQQLIDEYQNVDVPELNQICLESDVGPEIAYHIAKNPHLMEKILALTPHRRMMELGKIEEKVSKKGISQPVVSRAPAPVQTDKGSAIVTKSLEDYGKDGSLSQSDYREARMANRKRR